MMVSGMRFRASEIVLLVHFLYTAILTLAFRLPADSVVKAWVLLLTAIIFLTLIARRSGGHSAWRDWAPPFMLLAAYRELELFAKQLPGHELEKGWQAIDRVLLNDWHLRAAIESAGWLAPLYLELTYLLVYGTGFFLMLMVYKAHRRDLAGRVLVVYLLGTLLAYAIIPFYPSMPPRLLFTDSGPLVTTPLRQLNLLIVNDAGVHTGVFPSAHVSSAFAAAWALLLVPEKRKTAWGMVAYAASVSVATVYGRYHYAVDAVAGLAVSLVGVAASRGVELLQRKWRGT